MCHHLFISLGLSDAYIGQWPRPSLVQIMAYLFEGKPLTAPLLAYCQLGCGVQFSVNLNLKLNAFTLEKAFENVVCKTEAVLFWSQSVKRQSLYLILLPHPCISSLYPSLYLILFSHHCISSPYLILVPHLCTPFLYIIPVYHPCTRSLYLIHLSHPCISSLYLILIPIPVSHLILIPHPCISSLYISSLYPIPISHPYISSLYLIPVSNPCISSLSRTSPTRRPPISWTRRYIFRWHSLFSPSWSVWENFARCVGHWETATAIWSSSMGCVSLAAFAKITRLVPFQPICTLFGHNLALGTDSTATSCGRAFTLTVQVDGNGLGHFHDLEPLLIFHTR